MSHHETLTDQIRRALAHLPDVDERKMFGGIAFMVNDKMCICVGGPRHSEMMVRVGTDRYETALKRRGARPTIMRDRPIKGYVDVADEGLADLEEWVELALEFNAELVEVG